MRITNLTLKICSRRLAELEYNSLLYSKMIPGFFRFLEAYNPKIDCIFHFLRFLRFSFEIQSFFIKIKDP